MNSKIIKISDSQGYRHPVTLIYEKNKIWLQFGYNKDILTEIKAMAGSKWHGFDEIDPKKMWSVADIPRNHFQLEYLSKENPYWRYDQTIKLPPLSKYNNSLKKELTVYEHQQETVEFIWQTRQNIIAEEMGLGKTLSVILAMEMSKVKYNWPDEDFWYVAPKAVLKAIERELWIWGSKVRPKFITYDELTKIMKNWPENQKSPKFLVFDEASALKTPTSQRSQAAKGLADGVRADWGTPNSKNPDIGFVVLMSGTPAPKSPADWWHLAEVACPGFLKEGDIHKFRNRLGVIVKRENTTTGGVFPQLITWRNSELKCTHCGEFADHPNHDPMAAIFSAKSKGDEIHKFEKGINEVDKLYRRLKGLVLVKFKKDCLDLPPKIYRIIELKPKKETLRAAQLITKSSNTVIEGLTRLRELSDGFQYVDRKVGKKTCDRCQGTRKAIDYAQDSTGEAYDKIEIICPNCDENGEIDRFERQTEYVETPKDETLKDLLEECEETGRITIYAGFTGAVDRVVGVCQNQGWHVIRLDSRGWHLFNELGTPVAETDHLSVFQDWKEKYPKVAFVAHPKSGGMGLTLTASAMFLFYSNDFNGQDRSQAEDRGHRPGMDRELGVTIVDLIHLPSDLKVRTNLLEKRNLELMSLGDLSEAITLERVD